MWQSQESALMKYVDDLAGNLRSLDERTTSSVDHCRNTLTRDLAWITITAWFSACLLLYCDDISADTDLPTKFTNIGGIANTRHNLTQLTIGAGYVNMNAYRNQYGEVCVFCHTPHGANTQIDLPLWNRTFNSSSYTTYDTLGTSSLTQEVTQPGINSLSCLSCHDGTLAVDSIINMPGSGGYSIAQQTSQNNVFLTANWTNASGPSPNVDSHLGLAPVVGCLACHAADAGVVGAGATDFSMFALGTDLTNDHPIGVTLPIAMVGVDFNDPTQNGSTVAFYDRDGDSRADTNEIRFYDTGDGFEVECASCHDPHGVPTAGIGSQLNSHFLRRPNDNSTVCLTCHIR